MGRNMFKQIFFIVGIAVSAGPLAAGGLFGESGLVRSDVGKILDEKIGPAVSGPGQVGMTLEQAIEAAPETRPHAPAPPQVTYQTIQQGQSAQQSRWEQQASEVLKMKVSSICLTASTACDVEPTVAGASCFCTYGGTVELGVVQ